MRERDSKLEAGGELVRTEIHRAGARESSEKGVLVMRRERESLRSPFSVASGQPVETAQSFSSDKGFGILQKHRFVLSAALL